MSLSRDRRSPEGTDRHIAAQGRGDGVWLDRVAGLGARYDARPEFPAESLAMLREAGLHRRFAADRGVDEVRDALRLVGRADLSTGRLFEGHVNALALVRWYGDAAQRRWLDGALDRGAWFGVWATEPAPGVRLLGDPAVLDGAKSFASGAGGLDYAIVTAQTGNGARRLVIVPASDGDRADLSGWRVRGMRASMSGRYDLSGLAVDDAMLLGAAGDYDREPRFTAGAWRFCAVQLGGIEALLAEVRAHLARDGADDAVRRARFADAVAAMRTAGFWVAEAARRFAEEAADAVPIALMARGVVERAGLDVMEAAARLLGTRSAFDGERADRIARDLSLYLRQGGPDNARDRAARAFLYRDPWRAGDRLW